MSKSTAEIINDRLNGKTYTRDTRPVSKQSFDKTARLKTDDESQKESIVLSKIRLADERGFRLQLEAKQEDAVDKEVKALFTRPVSYSSPTLITKNLSKKTTKEATPVQPERLFSAKLGVASVQSTLAKAKSVESKMAELESQKGFSRTPVSIAKMAG